MKMKLLIMLTAFRDFGARIIRLMTRCRYTHASIALGEDPGTFYSFSLKGFRIEHPKGLLRKRKEPFPCRVYSIDVPEGIYLMAKHLIGKYATAKEKYRYSVIGVILAMLHIPLAIGKHFFCSHFVAYILERSGAMHLGKKSCLYMPGDLERLNGLSLSYTGTIQDYALSFA